MRKFNVRPPVIFALSMCAGIAAGAIMRFFGISGLWLILAAAPAAVVCAASIFKRRINKAAVIFLAAILAFTIGAIDCFSVIKSFASSEITPGETYELSGKVIEKGITNRGEYAIVDNLTADGKKISGRLYVYLSDGYGEIFEVGYTVKIYGEPQISEPFEYGKISYRALEGVKYGVSVNGGLQSTYGFSLLGSVRGAIQRTLFNNLSEETAAVTFAMLTGNTEYFEEQSLESFRYGGIAHIFAVSGLHIGILFGIASFLCKKLRLNKYVSAVICLGTVFFYSAVCGFTLSSVRAAVMCAASVLSKILMQKYDGLNSLSFAVVAILLFKPLSLFSVGFQLSVCATAGIFIFSRIISKKLSKIKIPKKISEAAGISFGAQITTSPVMLASFGYLSGAGILLNIVVVPLLSVIYVVLFVSTLVCAAAPPLAPFLMPYAALPLEFFMSVFLGAGFEKALISGFGAGLFVPIYFLGALALGDKLNLKLLARIIAAVGTAVILTGYVLIMYSYPFAGFAVTVSSYRVGGEILLKSSAGTVLIVTDNANVSRLDGMLNRNYCNGIDALVLVGDNAAYAYGKLEIECGEIYLNDRETDIQPYETPLKYESRFTVCGVNFRFFDDSTLFAEAGGVTMGICSDGHFALPDCDILISDTQNVFINCKAEIYFNNRCGELNVYDCGDIRLIIQDGNFSVKNSIPPRR